MKLLIWFLLEGNMETKVEKKGMKVDYGIFRKMLVRKKIGEEDNNGIKRKWIIRQNCRKSETIQIIHITRQSTDPIANIGITLDKIKLSGWTAHRWLLDSNKFYWNKHQQ